MLRILIVLSGVGDLGAILAGPLGDVIVALIGINLMLMVFNLIPVPPLDGHHILYLFLPPSGQQAIERIGPFGILIVILLARPIFRLVMPPLYALVQWLAFAGTGMG